MEKAMFERERLYKVVEYLGSVRAAAQFSITGKL